MNNVMFGLAIAGLALAAAGALRLVWEATGGAKEAIIAPTAQGAAAVQPEPVSDPLPFGGIYGSHVVATVFDENHQPKGEMELGNFRVVGPTEPVGVDVAAPESN